MQEVQEQRTGTGGAHFLAGAAITCIIVSVLLEVLIQLLPPHYSPISQSESSLAVGPYGYLMAINFVIRGLLTFLFIAAFVRLVPRAGRSRTGLFLLGLSGVEKFVIAVYATDLTPRPETVHGEIHALAALSGFFFEGLGILLMARALRHVPHGRPSQRSLVALATVTFIWSLVVIATVAVSAQIGVWGLLERILTVLLLLWLYLIACGLWRSSASKEIPQQTFTPYDSGEMVSRR